MYDSAEEVFALLDKGKEHHRRLNLYEQTRRNYDFFEGRQWEGLSAPVEPPVNNVIKHIVTFKFNTMAMQDIQTVFSTDEAGYEDYTNMLNDYAEDLWQRMKLHDRLWRMAKEASIAGDNYIYIADEDKAQNIDNVDIYFANENNSDIQSQKYIIITERLYTDDVREAAKANKIPANELDMIVSDEDITERKNIIEVKNTTGKCTSILLMWKENGTVHALRAVKNLIYQPAVDTEMKLYPLIGLVINERKGSARGIGEVQPLINNQIALNKTLYRRVEAIKDTAFPKLVYREGAVQNPNEISKVGAKIAIKNSESRLVNDVISYLQPSYIGNDAKQLTDELILLTKELNGSGDGATGQINPEKVSGEAVKAVTHQASISSSEAQAAYKRAVEDIGHIILEWWKNYNPNGLKTEEGVIPAEALENVKLDINVSPATPYDKFSVEQILKELFQMQAISFEEYVSALDENGNMPKAKLQSIIDSRAQQKADTNQQIISQLQQQLAGYEAQGIEGIGNNPQNAELQ